MLSLLLGLALAGSCDLTGAPQDAFRVQAPTRAATVRVLIELWPDEGQEAWAEAMLQVFEERGLAATLVVPLPDAEGPTEEVLAWAERAERAGHEVAVHFTERQLPRDALQGPAPMKRRLKPLRQAAGGVRTAVASLPSRPTEASLGRLGFRNLIQERGPATAVPRPAVVFEGQPRIGVVIHAGPYAGVCGVRPFASPFTPAAADRATQAMWGAARIDGVPAIRVAIEGQPEAGADPVVLGRWLDEVVTPAGARVSTANAIRTATLAFFRTGRTMASNPLEAGGGRLVSVSEVRDAAARLADENLLPRRLPGDLNLSETFMAFSLLLADQAEGDVIRLSALSGPQSHANSRLEGIITLDPQAVAALASAIVSEPPTAVPAALPVGERTLNAAELLTAMASAIRGEDPVQSWPTASPDSSVPGQGWGAATLP